MSKCRSEGVATLEPLPSHHCVSPCPGAMPCHSAERPLRVTLPHDHCASLCPTSIACHAAWHLLRVTLPRHHALSPCQATITCDYARHYARHYAVHSVGPLCRDTIACHSSCHILPPYLPVNHVRHVCQMDLSGLSASTTCQASMAVTSGRTYVVYICRTYLSHISAAHICVAPLATYLPGRSCDRT